VRTQKQEELITLDAGSPDLYACFLSAVSLLRRHFLEDDGKTKPKTAKAQLNFTTVFYLNTDKWECSLSHPSSITTFESGFFTRKDLATCWVVFVSCKELRLGYPEMGNTVANKPTHVLACIGEKLMKMIYATQGFASFPHEDEDSFSDRCVAQFVRTTVASAYFRGGLSFALAVPSGVVGPMKGILA
ncbi:hypothetical protein BGZ49_001340, partial [Haplosporangium sp. Z 27]